MERQRIEELVWKDFRGTGWEDMYRDAPTALAGWYTEVKLYVEAFEITDEETAECMAEIYDIQGRMTLEDWKYVYRLCRRMFYLELREEARYQIKLKENGGLSCEDWHRLFTTLDGPEDPFWTVCLQKMLEMAPMEPSSGNPERGA
ncbi:MAG: hypothetical protein LUD50_06685 [Clostridia bacterium]|nr:hypothetical protein [Clostridia bacterium]